MTHRAEQTAKHPIIHRAKICAWNDVTEINAMDVRISAVIELYSKVCPGAEQYYTNAKYSKDLLPFLNKLMR